MLIFKQTNKTPKLNLPDVLTTSHTSGFYVSGSDDSADDGFLLPALDIIHTHPIRHCELPLWVHSDSWRLCPEGLFPPLSLSLSSAPLLRLCAPLRLCLFRGGSAPRLAQSSPGSPPPRVMRTFLVHTGHRRDTRQRSHRQTANKRLSSWIVAGWGNH